MDGCYDISLNGHAIGTAQVSVQGLYYLIKCECSFPKESVYRIVAVCSDHRENLGVCTPTSHGFGLQTKIPRKRLGEGELAFIAEDKHAQPSERFFTVRPEEPFPAIAQLSDAYLRINNGAAGIVFRGSVQRNHQEEAKNHGTL